MSGRLAQCLRGAGRAVASAARARGQWIDVRQRPSGAAGAAGAAAVFAASGVALGMWRERGARTGEGCPERALLEGWTAQCEGAAAPQRDLRNQFRYFISNAVDKAAPSVVKISCLRDDHWHAYESSGSGFVFEEDGSILTNAHVVQGARKVTIILRDGTQLPGAVENLDALSDVAIVRAQGGKGQLPVATLGRSTDLRVGEWIVAMGSPGGNLKDTVTVGIVSALLRPSSDLGMSARRMTYIQTDAAINQGNSGGPIINVDGEVVAISSMKAAHLDGVGFAIPIDLAKEMVRQMRVHGKVLRPHMGIKMLTIGPGVLAELRQSVRGFPKEVRRGVLLAQVLPQSPAAKAGLMSGDVLVEFDGSPVIESGQVHNLLGDDVGRQINIKVVRIQDGKARLLQKTVTTEACE